MGPQPMMLGHMPAQLVPVLDAARAERSANVIVSCGPAAVELGFSARGVVAEAAWDASKVGGTVLSLEDQIVLEILGWHRGGRTQECFTREWHEDTATQDIAADVLRALMNAYRCADEDSVAVRVVLSSPRVNAAV